MNADGVGREEEVRQSVLHAALIRVPEFADVTPDALVPMRVKGLVHEHVRVQGRGVVLRVPHLSQFGLGPADNLAYQIACFERAGPSGATPLLRAVLPITRDLPWGALVVDDIDGRTPVLPADMAAIADSLAAFHTLPVPDEAARPPLLVHEDPVAGTLAVIDFQATFLARAELLPRTLDQIETEIGWARRFAAETKGRDHPVTLVGTDTHPGNFLMTTDGRAVFIDLEKALYGSPAIDLAHASVYTSTMWDPDIGAALNADQVASFQDRYLRAVPPDFADRLRPWLAPMRRLTWLRTTTWAAKWRVETAARAATADPDSWPARQRRAGLAEGVRARIDDYFDPETIAGVRHEWGE